MSARSRKITTALSACAATLAILQAWAGRFTIEPDGVNYLDVARAYIQHDYKHAINSYWSPLYSWLLAMSLRLSQASPYEESTVLHVLNCLFFLFALLSFTFFLKELTAFCEQRYPQYTCPGNPEPPTWQIFAYILFIYAMLLLIGLELDTPDLGVAAWFFLATGYVARIGRSVTRWRDYSVFGGVLGAAYLTKAVMFPLGFVFLFCATLAPPLKFKNALKIALSALLFLAVSGPFLLALSRAQGRLTFGDTGWMNYAFYVDGLVEIPHWHGEIPGLGSPIHGTHTVFHDPTVEEFNAPAAGGTYPPWYDPSYWLDGLSARFSLKGQVRASLACMREYGRIFSAERVLAAVLLLLLTYASRPWRYLQQIARMWFVWTPAIATLAVYALVHVETRFLGAPLVILWLSLFYAARFHHADISGRLLDAATMAMAATLSVAIITKSAQDLATVLRPGPHEQWIVASELDKLGLRSGDSVAVLGHTTVADYWAHLANVHVVADVPRTAMNDFWSVSHERQNEALAAIARTGAKFLVTSSTPPPGQLLSWHQIGNTSFWELRLPISDAPTRP